MDMYLNAEGELDYTYTDSATKHYSKQVIHHIIRNPIMLGFKRPNVLAYIGFYNLAFIEVFVDMINQRIFHCSKATKDTLNRVRPVNLG
jgi:hypothetical protein